jgi:hypothetical protein
MLAMVAQLYAAEDEAKAKIAELMKSNPAVPIDERHAITRTSRQE